VQTDHLAGENARLITKATPEDCDENDNEDTVDAGVVGDVLDLADIGRLGLIMITRDKRLRYSPAERRLLVEHHVRVVKLTSNKNLSNWDRLRLVARFWDDIEAAAGTPGPLDALRDDARSPDDLSRLAQRHNR